MFNVQQTNLQETKPEKWEALKEQFKIPAIKDEQGMLTVPLIDAMVREQQWICPIYSKEGNSAYHARGEDNHIVVPLKGQFKDGENFYSTLLHEMAHSTGEPEHLNREKGVISETSNMPKRNWLPNSPPLPSGKAWEYPPISGKKMPCI